MRSGFGKFEKRLVNKRIRTRAKLWLEDEDGSPMLPRAKYNGWRNALDCTPDQAAACDAMSAARRWYRRTGRAMPCSTYEKVLARALMRWLAK